MIGLQSNPSYFCFAGKAIRQNTANVNFCGKINSANGIQNFGNAVNVEEIENKKRYEQMQKGISEIKSYFADIENNENVVGGKTLKVVDDKVCTYDGTPFSGVSKTAVRPGGIMYGEFENGKLNTVSSKFGKLYITVDVKNAKVTTYSADSDGKEYLNKISFDKNNGTTSIYTLAGNDKKVNEYSQTIDNIRQKAKSAKKNVIQTYAEFKKLFGEDATCDLLGRALIGAFVFGNDNRKETEIYKDAKGILKNN